MKIIMQEKYKIKPDFSAMIPVQFTPPNISEKEKIVLRKNLFKNKDLIFSEYEKEVWEERSAIIEFDAMFEKQDAEMQAFHNILAQRITNDNLENNLIETLDCVEMLNYNPPIPPK